MMPPSPTSPPEGSLPFVGIATFAGYPLWDGEKMNVDAVVVGVPFDEGTTYRPGTRLGPRAIRDASMFYAYEGQKDRYYDADRRRWILKDRTVADWGDVMIEPMCPEKNQKTITHAVRHILEQGSLPVVLGGDHSITFPVVQAFGQKGLHYIHFDSHIDGDRIFESRWTHGSPVYNLLEEGLVESVTVIGVRGLTNSGHDVAWIEKKGSKIITARELRRMLAEGARPFGSGDYYLSLDIDFFDPSVAPGTGTPEPGGMGFHEFSDLLYLFFENVTIKGFDVVEVNPLLDNRSQTTAHLAARCIIEMLEIAFKNH